MSSYLVLTKRLVVEVFNPIGRSMRAKTPKSKLCTGNIASQSFYTEPTVVDIGESPTPEIRSSSGNPLSEHRESVESAPATLKIHTRTAKVFLNFASVPNLQYTRGILLNVTLYYYMPQQYILFAFVLVACEWCLTQVLSFRRLVTVQATCPLWFELSQ